MHNKHNFIFTTTRRLRINKLSSLRHLAGRICEMSHPLVSPLFPALEVPGSQKWGLGWNRKKLLPQVRAEQMTKEENAWFWLCLFFLVCRVCSSRLPLESSFILCVLSCGPGRKTETKRKEKKKSWYWKHLDFYMCLAPWESMFLFVLLDNNFKAFPWNIWKQEIHIKDKDSCLNWSLAY